MSEIRNYPRHFGKKLRTSRERKYHNKIGYRLRLYNQLRKKRRRTRRLTSTLVVSSQNLQGFAKDSRSKGRGKREEIIHKMTKHNINICCVQDLNCKQHGNHEWKNGSYLFKMAFSEVNIKNGGVGIILDAETQKAWRLAGEPELIVKKIQGTTRICALHIQYNKKDLIIISAYFPTANDNSIEEFYEALDSVLETNKDKEPIIGADVNAQIGLFNNQHGKFGISTINDRGKLLNRWLAEKNMYPLSTYFKKKKYDTFRHVRNGVSATYDFIFANTKLKKLTLDASACEPLVQSDHDCTIAEFGIKEPRQ